MRPSDIEIGKVYKIRHDATWRAASLIRVTGKSGREFITVDGQRHERVFPARQIDHPWGSYEDAEAHYEAELQQYDRAREAQRRLTELGLSAKLTKREDGYRFEVADLHIDTAEAMLSKVSR
jgi:hypothetical protein